MIISLVVAASENNAIGRNNKLLWHLPNDMRFFKNVTWAMPVIMGRKTFESLGNKPLPGRFNIVVTSHTELPSSGKIMLSSSIENALSKAKETDCKEVFIIGGGEIFKETISKANKIYLTRVHAHLDGDVFFPELDTTWTMTNSEDHIMDDKHAFGYSFQWWERKENK